MNVCSRCGSSLPKSDADCLKCRIWNEYRAISLHRAEALGQMTPLTVVSDLQQAHILVMRLESHCIPCRMDWELRGNPIPAADGCGRGDIGVSVPEHMLPEARKVLRWELLQT